MRRLAAVVALVAVVPAGAAGCATGATHTLYSENDVFAAGRRDRYYTNGARLTGLYRTNDAPGPVAGVAESLPSPVEGRTTQIGWIVGQEIYTPADITDPTPPRDDRPYGGWLYAGVLAARAVRGEDGPRGDRVDVLEVDVGVTGPESQAEACQKWVHQRLAGARPRGWDTQLPFEPGLVARLEHRRRLLAAETPLGASYDVLGIAGVAAGNVFTHAAAGAIVRWGWDPPRDFGPNTIHSTAVDVPDRAEDAGPRWYLFAGAEGRAVVRNLFLDGTLFRDSASVDKNRYVGEARFGLAFEWRGFRITLTEIRRTREFDAQDRPHDYGSVALTLDWLF